MIFALSATSFFPLQHIVTVRVCHQMISSVQKPGSIGVEKHIEVHPLPLNPHYKKNAIKTNPTPQDPSTLFQKIHTYTTTPPHPHDPTFLSIPTAVSKLSSCHNFSIFCLLPLATSLFSLDRSILADQRQSFTFLFTSLQPPMAL